MKIILKYRLQLTGALLLLVTIWLQTGFAQSPIIEVEAAVDRNIITIGDRITYTLRIIHDRNLEVREPGPGANLGMFEIKDYQIYDPVEQEGKLIRQFDYVISVFDTGTFVIPPFPVAFAASDTAADFQVINSEPIEIQVESVLQSADAELKDIKPPLNIPYDYWRWIGFGALLLLLIAAVVGGYYFYQKKKRGEPIFRKQMIRPAHEIALEELAALESGDLLQKAEVKEFYTRLSDILKRYLENRFFIGAMEETTQELMESVREMELDEEAEIKLYLVLELSDMVKFAKYLPGEPETGQAIQKAKEFIELTRLDFQPVEVLEPVTTSKNGKPGVPAGKSNQNR